MQPSGGRKFQALDIARVYGRGLSHTESTNLRPWHRPGLLPVTVSGVRLDCSHTRPCAYALRPFPCYDVSSVQQL